MDTEHARTAPWTLMLIFLGAVLLVAVSCRAVPAGLFDSGSEEPEPTTTSIAKSMCDSAADLRVDVEFLRSLQPREDGLVAVLVAVDTALGEARTLATLVAEEYQPYVADLVLSLESLRVTVDQLEGEETVGAGIASIGETIVGIGAAMDALELELRDPCPQSS